MQEALEFFLEYYREHCLDYTTLYPGVKEALDRLRAAGKRLAVLTNKPVRMSRTIVDGLGMGGHFFQSRQDAVHVLVGIHEDDDDRQLSAYIHQMSSFDAMPS